MGGFGGGRTRSGLYSVLRTKRTGKDKTGDGKTRERQGRREEEEGTLFNSHP